jgi:hypothetical protein
MIGDRFHAASIQVNLEGMLSKCLRIAVITTFDDDATMIKPSLLYTFLTSSAAHLSLGESYRETRLSLPWD